MNVLPSSTCLKKLELPRSNKNVTSDDNTLVRSKIQMHFNIFELIRARQCNGINIQTRDHISKPQQGAENVIEDQQPSRFSPRSTVPESPGTGCSWAWDSHAFLHSNVLLNPLSLSSASLLLHVSLWCPSQSPFKICFLICIP